MPKPRDCPFYYVCALDEVNCTECSKTGMNYLATHVYLKKAGMPPAYLPGNVHPGDIIRIQGSGFRAYVRELTQRVDNGEGAFIYSRTTGNGKTTVGCALLLKYLYHTAGRFITTDVDTPVAYINVVDYLETLRREMNNPSDWMTRFMELQFSHTTAPALLLLDDIGAEKPSDWVKERLYSLINFRVNHKLATIYTSNCTPEELQDTLGSRIYSRIVGSTIQVPFKGTDHRVGG